jgi:hypothetical protein
LKECVFFQKANQSTPKNTSKRLVFGVNLLKLEDLLQLECGGCSAPFNVMSSTCLNASSSKEPLILKPFLIYSAKLPARLSKAVFIHKYDCMDLQSILTNKTQRIILFLIPH